MRRPDNTAENQSSQPEPFGSIPVPRGPERYDRFVLDARVPFTKLVSVLGSLGIPLAHTAPPSDPEPRVAVFTSGGTHVAYRYLRSANFRLVEIRGPRASDLYAAIVLREAIPVVDAARIIDLLSPSRATVDQMRGLVAAEHLGVHGDERTFMPAVIALVRESNLDVASRAAALEDELRRRMQVG